jgi:hypothetical protein
MLHNQPILSPCDDKAMNDFLILLAAIFRLGHPTLNVGKQARISTDTTTASGT